MAVAAHERLGKIAVAYASDMVRVYEPTLVSEDTQSNNDMEVDSNITRYKWTEVSKWRCQLVQWLAWDNFVGNNNPFVACASADGTYVSSHIPALKFADVYLCTLQPQGL